MCLGLLHHRDDPSKSGISSHLGDLETDTAQRGKGSSKDTAARTHFNRHRFTRNGGLIDGGLPTEKNRQHLSRFWQCEFAILQALDEGRTTQVGPNPGAETVLKLLGLFELIGSCTQLDQ